MQDPDLVTVIVPARDEDRFIDACLSSIREQDYPHLQVVVVDGASTDATADVVRAHMGEDDRIELVHNDRRNIPSSLNLALARARGRWLVRVDAHSTVPPDYVSTAVARLAKEPWGGVGGRKDGAGRTPAGRAIAVAMSSRLAVGNSTYHFGTRAQEVDHLPFGAYPTELVRSLGGWDERLTANEDFEFDYRMRQAGHRLLFDPDMTIRWHCRQSVPDLFRQYERYGRGKLDVALLHPDSLRPRHLAPPLLVVYLLGAALVGIRRPLLAEAMVAPYVAALAAESARLARALDRPGERARVPVAIAAMHTAWGIGFWSGLGRRLVTGREAGATGRGRAEQRPRTGSRRRSRTGRARGQRRPRATSLSTMRPGFRPREWIAPASRVTGAVREESRQTGPVRVAG